MVELNSEYRDRRKDAVKRVIANMTVGKDVSSLFPQVVKNMQTEDLEMVNAWSAASRKRTHPMRGSTTTLALMTIS